MNAHWVPPGGCAPTRIPLKSAGRDDTLRRHGEVGSEEGGSDTKAESGSAEGCDDAQAAGGRCEGCCDTEASCGGTQRSHHEEAPSRNREGAGYAPSTYW
jgi:hypothetical protein